MKEQSKNCSFVSDKRIKCAEDFSRTFELMTKKIKSRHFIVPTFFVVENKSEMPRLGVVVSKKVSKLAVQRNRIKRLVRESFRQAEMPNLAIDCVVVAKRHAAKVESQKLTEDLASVWLEVARSYEKSQV